MISIKHFIYIFVTMNVIKKINLFNLLGLITIILIYNAG